MIVIDCQDREGIAKFVSDNIKGRPFFEKFSTLGIYENGCIIAGCVYNNFHEGADINISIASTAPKWASRRTIKAILAYPFNQLGCRRVTASIRKSNKKSRSLVERLGFVLEGHLRNYYKDDSLLIYGMTKKEAMRWLK